MSYFPPEAESPDRDKIIHDLRAEIVDLQTKNATLSIGSQQAETGKKNHRLNGLSLLLAVVTFVVGLLVKSPLPIFDIWSGNDRVNLACHDNPESPGNTLSRGYHAEPTAVPAWMRFDKVVSIDDKNNFSLEAWKAREYEIGRRWAKLAIDESLRTNHYSFYLYTLCLIGLAWEDDDIFSEKAKDYLKQADDAINKAIIIVGEDEAKDPYFFNLAVIRYYRVYDYQGALYNIREAKKCVKNNPSRVAYYDEVEKQIEDTWGTPTRFPD